MMLGKKSKSTQFISLKHVLEFLPSSESNNFNTYKQENLMMKKRQNILILAGNDEKTPKIFCCYCENAKMKLTLLEIAKMALTLLENAKMT